jgi:hypothetical protein
MVHAAGRLSGERVSELHSSEIWSVALFATPTGINETPVNKPQRLVIMASIDLGDFRIPPRGPEACSAPRPVTSSSMRESAASRSNDQRSREPMQKRNSIRFGTLTEAVDVGLCECASEEDRDRGGSTTTSATPAGSSSPRFRGR